MIAPLTRRPGCVAARVSRGGAHRGKGGLASPGSGKHDHGDRGPGSSRCRHFRIPDDDAARASNRAAASGRACPEADRACRPVVRHCARRMRLENAGARTAGKAGPHRRRSTTGVAHSPARPRAAHAAAGARLRVQGIIRPQAGGSRSMGAAETRLRAAMLPGCGAGDAQAPGAAAGGEPVPDRTGTAFIAGRALTLPSCRTCPFFDTPIAVSRRRRRFYVLFGSVNNRLIISIFRYHGGNFSDGQPRDQP